MVKYFFKRELTVVIFESGVKMPLLKVENVSYSYDKKTKALKNVSFCADKGEHIAIIGHNGSGKSTLAKLLNGLILPESGTVSVDGALSSDKEKRFEIRKKVGVVFQNPDNGIIASIVEDDIAFGPENLGVPRKEIGERIDFALKAVGMEEYRNASPARLSGGQKQRVAIAGVLALRPEILVLDESTAMLDPQGRKEILSVVDKLKKEQGVTVITITHYMEEAAQADKIFVLSHGEEVMRGSAEEIFRDGEKLKSFGLELPYPAYIAQKLREKGVPIEGAVLSESDLAEKLVALCR